MRLLTGIATRAPWAWRATGSDRVLRAIFDGVAGSWDRKVAGQEWALPLEAGLAALRSAPRTALDVGTGTGLGARIVAARFPSARVVGVDLSPGMIRRARERPDNPPNVRFEVCDSSHLPFEDRAFDLVVCLNVPLFFAELARVTAPGGHVLVCYSLGRATPIYVPERVVARRLEERGFDGIRSESAGRGVWTLARR